jgi:hypothetical protein
MGHGGALEHGHDGRRGVLIATARLRSIIGTVSWLWHRVTGCLIRRRKNAILKVQYEYLQNGIYNTVLINVIMLI